MFAKCLKTVHFSRVAPYFPTVLDCGVSIVCVCVLKLREAFATLFFVHNNRGVAILDQVCASVVVGACDKASSASSVLPTFRCDGGLECFEERNFFFASTVRIDWFVCVFFCSCFACINWNLLGDVWVCSDCIKVVCEWTYNFYFCFCWRMVLIGNWKCCQIEKHKNK